MELLIALLIIFVVLPVAIYLLVAALKAIGFITMAATLAPVAYVSEKKAEKADRVETEKLKELGLKWDGTYDVFIQRDDERKLIAEGQNYRESEMYRTTCKNAIVEKHLVEVTEG